MKFGIFYEHQLPKPWLEDSEYQLFQDSLDQIELADKLGYDVAWEVEHHFLEEYSHSSAPEVFLAAASQRTKNIRLGHGIIQNTTNHPHRVAERVSTLDLLSGGRVEFGMGEGASITELGPFDCPLEDKREIWEDAVRAVIPMFKEGGFEYDGPHFKFPLRNVLPKPVQKPHPPVILGGETDYTLRRVVEFCDGWLPRGRDGFDMVDGMARLGRVAEEAGRATSSISVTVFGAPPERGTLDSYKEMGIDSALFRLPSEGRDSVLKLLDEYTPLID